MVEGILFDQDVTREYERI